MSRASRNALAALLLLAPAPVLAQAGCGLIWPLQLSADPVSFGTYVPASGTPASANGSITVACASGTFGTYLPSFTVALSTGSGGSGFNPRRMSNAGYRLSYNLYSNGSFSIIWGDGSGGTQVRGFSAGSYQRSTSLTVYGNVPASQLSAAGAFTDTINVTITY